MAHNLVFREGTDHLSEEILVRLYDSVGWIRYAPTHEALMQAVTNSTYVTTCWDNSKLIGLARSLSDEVAIHYVQDLLVDPQYQRQGIGGKLLDRCFERFARVRTHVLMTDDAKYLLRFYEANGWHNTRKLRKHMFNTFIRSTILDLA